MAIFFLSDISLLLSVMRVADCLLFACRTLFCSISSILIAAVSCIFPACVFATHVSVILSPAIFIRALMILTIFIRTRADQTFGVKSDQVTAVCL